MQSRHWQGHLTGLMTHVSPLGRSVVRWRRLVAAAMLLVAACGEGAEESLQTTDMAAPEAVTFTESREQAPGRDAATIGDAFGTGSARPGLPGSGGGVTRAAVRVEPPPMPAPPPMQPAPDQTPGSQSSGADQPGSGGIVPTMLIRTGNAVIEVDSLEIAISEVRLLAQRLGGWIATTSMQTGQGQIRSATLEMKIPADRFDEARGGLTPLGKVEAINDHSEDVGEEYVDLTARMTNARRLEERLLSLLANRTGKLEDVLAVERELARVREQIERFEGRMRFLSTRARVSTLSVTVHEPRPLIGSNPGRSIIGEAFRDAWRNFVGFIAGLIAMMGVLIPLGVLAIVLWLLWRRFGPRLPPRRGDTAP